MRGHMKGVLQEGTIIGLTISRGFQTSSVAQFIPPYTLHSYEQFLFASKTKFVYNEFDVNYHRQATGQKPCPVIKTEFAGPPPSPLFGLIPAQFGIIACVRKMEKYLGVNISTFKLSEHFVKFGKQLPGCAYPSSPLACSGMMIDVTDTRDKSRANVIINGKYFTYF